MTEIVSEVRRVRERPPSVEQVYREQHAHLWRALLAYSGDPEVASDAASEAFAQALRRGDAVKRPDRWVWKSAFRIAAGMLKDRSRYVAEVDPSVDGHNPLLELRWALMELSPRQRAATFLFYYGGYAPAEIAHMIGSTQSAVRVHLFRGRKHLEHLLTEAEK